MFEPRRVSAGFFRIDHHATTCYGRDHAIRPNQRYPAESIGSGIDAVRSGVDAGTDRPPSILPSALDSKSPPPADDAAGDADADHAAGDELNNAGAEVDSADVAIDAAGQDDVDDSDLVVDVDADDVADLTAAIDRAGLSIDATAVPPLAAFARVMWHWNEQLNLTRHTTWDLFVSRDLRDAVALAELIGDDEDVLDWGSGNGVPGIPLAILRPDASVSLVESVGKRAATLGEIVAALGLPVTVYGCRGETLLEDFRFSTVVARAVGSIAKFCRWIEPHWLNADRLLLVKGPRWVDERGEARHLGLMRQLELRRAATYPLETQTAALDTAGEASSDSRTDGEAGMGVILEIKRHRPT